MQVVANTAELPPTCLLLLLLLLPLVAASDESVGLGNHLGSFVLHLKPHIFHLLSQECHLGTQDVIVCPRCRKHLKENPEHAVYM